MSDGKHKHGCAKPRSTKGKDGINEGACNVRGEGKVPGNLDRTEI